MSYEVIDKSRKKKYNISKFVQSQSYSPSKDGNDSEEEKVHYKVKEVKEIRKIYDHPN